MSKKIKEVITNAGNTGGKTKQEESIFSGIDGIIEPRIDSKALLYAYNQSFVLGGLVNRISQTAASGFIYPENIPPSSKAALESLDLEFIFASMFMTGNAFVEKIRNKIGTLVVDFENFMTPEVRIARKEEGVRYIQRTSTTMKHVEFEREDVLHFKQMSLNSRWYGESRSTQAIQQIVLLGHIDKFYEKVFLKGFLKTKVIKDEKVTLEEEHVKKIIASVDDRIRGEEGAFNIMYIPGAVDIEDLDSEIDTEAFLKYRIQLIQSIAIALTVPIDIVLPEWSARATKSSSLEELNRDIILPLQERFLMQLKKQITEQELPGISEVKLYPIDTKNSIDEMRIYTGYKNAGIYTANMVLNKLGEEPHPDGDQLTPSKSVTPDSMEEKEMQEIYKTIEHAYDTYEH